LGLTYTKFVEIRKEIVSLGYKQFEPSNSIEAGILVGTFMTEFIKNNDNSKTMLPIYELFCFNLKDNLTNKDVLYYSDLIWFNLIHPSSGKSYAPVKILVTDEIIQIVSNIENLSKKIYFEAIPDSQFSHLTYMRLKRWTR
jgi:hypothetical protein